MTEGPRHTLSKTERLSGKTSISRLVSHGRYGNESCLRFCVLKGNSLCVSRILISVPKRNFRRAVKRNLLKRRIREAYRLRKELLGPGFDIMFIYTAREVLPSAEIAAAVEKVLLQIAAGGDE